MEISASLTSLLSILAESFSWLSDDPVLQVVQVLLIFLAAILIFFVFFTTRDILLRSHSLVYQVGSIALVALIPVIGFLIYLLIRPQRTIRQRELEQKVEEMWQTLHGESKEESEEKKEEDEVEESKETEDNDTTDSKS